MLEIIFACVTVLVGWCSYELGKYGVARKLPMMQVSIMNNTILRLSQMGYLRYKINEDGELHVFPLDYGARDGADDEDEETV